MNPNPSNDTLRLHREMYERRMRRMRQLAGLTEREVSEKVNDPRLFRRNVPEGNQTLQSENSNGAL